MKIAITFLFTLLFVLFACSQQKMVFGTFKRVPGFPKDLPRPTIDSLEFPLFIGKQYIVLKRFKKVEMITNNENYAGTWKFRNGTVELTFLIDSQQQTLLLQIAQTKKNTYLLDPNNKFRSFKKQSKDLKFSNKIIES